jgi:hypothetical protein
MIDGATGADLALSLTALAVLGLATLGVLFAFVYACDRV